MRTSVLGLLAFCTACAAPGLTRSRTEPVPLEHVRTGHGRGVHLGVVSRRDVELDALHLRLDEGRRCPRRRLPQAEGGIVTSSAADQAGCRIYPYRGEVPVFAVVGDREELEVLRLVTSLDGSVVLRFARVDASLRAMNAGSIVDYDRLVIGRGGWAGTVDLIRLRTFLADWHSRWVAGGRGSAGLFAVLHEDHPRATMARQWAVDARVRRQEADQRLVERGEMSAATFLERHVWSPFRSSAESFLFGRETKTVTAEEEVTPDLR